MRRDEIRPFRGDTESHLKRLRSFNPEPRLPIDRYERPKPADPVPLLDYASPRVMRALRWMRVRMVGESLLRVVALTLAGSLLLLAMCAMSGGFAPVLLLLGCAALPAIIWLTARLTQRFR